MTYQHRTAAATNDDRIDFDQFARFCATFMVPQFIYYPQQRADGRIQMLRLLSNMLDTQRCGRIQRSDFHRAMKYLLGCVPPSDGVANVPELERLEELTFGSRHSLTYEKFEDRLATTGVERRLAINKWLEEDKVGSSAT